MKAAVLGGTRGIGRALARLLAERGDRVFLLGRHPADLERSVADLEIRSPGSAAGAARCDLEEPGSFEPALVRAREAMDGLDLVVVTAAAFDTQEALEADPALAAQVLTSGFTGTVLFCEVARKALLAEGGGTLCVLSSVAGDRARKPVVLYGSAKAGLTYYLDGLDLRFRRAGLRTVCVKPGFVRTAMTAGLKPPPFSADAESVARRALRAIDRGWPTVYAPPVWRPVMIAIRLLPRFLRRRLGF